MKRQYFVYIIANDSPTLYIGVTSNLLRRVYEHKTGAVEGFSKRYALKKLVYYEQYDDIREAMLREKRLKKWCRDWKMKLIRKSNPYFVDLYEELTASGIPDQGRG